MPDSGGLGGTSYANKGETSLDVTANRRHLGRMKLDSINAASTSLDRINLRLSGYRFAQIGVVLIARA